MAQNNLGNMVEKYTTRLDKQITAGACTADLNMNQDLLGEMTGAGVINIATIAMDGLADHVRGRGFVRGGAELKWTPYQLEFERDREFVVDEMDDAEPGLGVRRGDAHAPHPLQPGGYHFRRFRYRCKPGAFQRQDRLGGSYWNLRADFRRRGLPGGSRQGFQPGAGERCDPASGKRD